MVMLVLGEKTQGVPGEEGARKGHKDAHREPGNQAEGSLST